MVIDRCHEAMSLMVETGLKPMNVLDAVTSFPTNPKIGFIGLGNMGAPMARNLAKAGHEVIGFDVNFEQASALRDILTIVETAADAAAGQDVVITMLPSNPHVLDTYCGEGGVLAALDEVM